MSKTLMISLSVHTDDLMKGPMISEVLNRAALGLAMEGVTSSVHMIMHECDEEHAEVNDDTLP